MKKKQQKKKNLEKNKPTGARGQAAEGTSGGEGFIIHV